MLVRTVRISKWSELNDAILSTIQQASIEANEEMKEVVEDSIDEVVYDAYEPEWYERSYDLKHSLDTEVIEVSFKGLKTKIYHDLNKINPNENLFQHWSIVFDKDVSEYIPYIVHEMGSHNLWQGEYAFTKPRPYMDFAEAQIEDGNLYGKAMKRALDKHGVKTK